MKRTAVLVFLTALALAPAGHAVTTGVDFLKLGIGARAAGMGEAFVAECHDVTANYWNPAGLARMERPELGIIHSDAVGDAVLEFVGFACPLRRGTLAVSGVFYVIKPVPVTLGSGEALGELNWTDMAFTVAYGTKLTGRLSCGIGGKVIRRMESDPIFGKSEGSAYAVDAGLTYETPVRGLRAGAALLNTGGELQMSGETKRDALPQTARAGLAYTCRLDRHAALVAAGDLHRVLDDNWRPGGGIELSLYDMIFIRTGYYEKTGNIKGNTYGMGFKLRRFRIDYSNIPASEMVGYTRNNKISVLVQF